jgi:hypothetical protein
MYFVTHFLFGHQLGKLSKGISVGLRDFKLFPLLPARRLHSRAITVASRSITESFVSDWKWRLILLSFIPYPEWKVLLHAVNAWHGTPGFTSLPKFLSPIIIHQLRLGLNLGSYGEQVITWPQRQTLWLMLWDTMHNVTQFSNYLLMNNGNKLYGKLMHH